MRIRTVSRVLVTEGGDSRPSWTLLVAEVWERCWKYDCVIVVDVCLYRVDEDVSGLTFEEWDPSEDTDSSQTPVVMIVNSQD